MSFTGPSKKCNYSSPGKTQTFIVLFTAQGKKGNVNEMPDHGQRSPLDRSFAAITGSP